MTNEEVQKIVGNTPHMTLHQATAMSELIETYDINDILELGFAHGVSTAYMASALGRKNSKGGMTSIDLLHSKVRTPNVETLLQKVGQVERVNVFFEPTSYTWKLMKMLEEDPEPRFDLCYLDGAHNWYVDGFAFFLVDRLLRPGGWIVFDDMNWTYAGSPTNRNTEKVRQMPEEERITPQVKKVYDLLVKTHPNYHNFKVENQWGYAQKRAAKELQ